MALPTKSIFYDGLNDYTEISHDATLSTTSSVTCIMYTKLDTIATANAIISKLGLVGSYSWAMRTQNGGKLRMLVSDNGTNTMDRQTTANAPTGWTTLAGVYDAPNQGLHTYIGGIRDDGALNGTVPASINANTAPLLIGRSSTAASDYMEGNGLFGAVWIGTALTDVQMQKAHNCGIHKGFVGIPGLPTPTSVWPQNETTVHPNVLDSVGNNDGTMKNMSSGSIVSEVPTGADIPSCPLGGHETGIGALNNGFYAHGRG